ncbi:unnamed protein product [Mytilus coruscus]|uniref:Uncharacterized protein n=1 Tax=Mytilus coruscus TaxID=42192 RepID=A0A6J8A2T9_MYTCO|nr:unnamed protein product [Mytilus coruscus]
MVLYSTLLALRISVDTHSTLSYVGSIVPFLLKCRSIEDLQICDDKGISSLDHFAVLCELNITKPQKQRKSVSFRKFKEINIENIEMDINNSLLLNERNTSVEHIVASYDSVLRTVLDRHAPEQSKVIIQRPNTKWYTDELRFAKRNAAKLSAKCEKQSSKFINKFTKNIVPGQANCSSNARRNITQIKFLKLDMIKRNC